MDYTERRIEIALHKNKIAFLLAGSLLLFSIGAWIVFGKPSTENLSWISSAKLLVAAYASLLFFGFGTIFTAKKMLDKTAGLVIDDNGITDNSGGLAAGFVLWSDIENISKIEIQGQRFIMLQVKNPEFYIERQTARWKRKGMALNYRLYGTPIFISANTLNIKFKELFILIHSRFLEGRKGLLIN